MVTAARDEHGLLHQQRLFADAYLLDPDRNAKAAYIKAGYAGRNNVAEAAAARLLRQVQVAAYIDMRLAEERKKAEKSFDITQERVLTELAGIAYLDPADLYDEHGGLLPIRDMPERVRRAISSIEHGKDGTKIKFWSKTAGADMLAKHLNLYDQHQKAGLGGVADLMREIAERRSPASHPVERARANAKSGRGG